MTTLADRARTLVRELAGVGASIHPAAVPGVELLVEVRIRDAVAAETRRCPPFAVLYYPVGFTELTNPDGTSEVRWNGDLARECVEAIRTARLKGDDFPTLALPAGQGWRYEPPADQPVVVLVEPNRET